MTERLAECPFGVFHPTAGPHLMPLRVSLRSTRATFLQGVDQAPSRPDWLQRQTTSRTTGGKAVMARLS
jgi:hypothetical protein